MMLTIKFGGAKEKAKVLTHIKCHIPGTWHNSSTVDIAVEESKNNLACDCWRIMPVTIEQTCQWLMKNHASHYWRIMPVTIEQSCQWMLNNRASDYWTIVPATVDISCQWLLNSCVSDSSISKCLGVMSVWKNSHGELMSYKIE